MRKKIKLGEVPKQFDFYWNEHQCFGGRVKKHLPNNKTLIVDYGSDGNHHFDRFESSDTLVYIEENVTYYWEVFARNWTPNSKLKNFGKYYSYPEAKKKVKKLEKQYETVFTQKRIEHIEEYSSG